MIENYDYLVNITHLYSVEIFPSMRKSGITIKDCKFLNVNAFSNVTSLSSTDMKISIDFLNQDNGQSF